MTNELQLLKNQMRECLEFLEKIDSDINRLSVSNNQEVLDFYDKLNEISIRK